MWQCVLVVFHVAVSILVMFCEAVPCLCDCFRHVLCGGVTCMFLSCLICLLSFSPVVSVLVMFHVSGSVSVMFHGAVSVSIMCPVLVICCTAVS